MPVQSSTNFCPSGSIPYTIRQGDTLGGIANSYNSTVSIIISANPFINPNFLMIGQQICIPQTLQYYPACPTTNYYLVNENDTFETISSFFNITPSQLLYANFGIDPDKLYQDQIICLPVAPSPVSLNIRLSNKTLIVFRNSTIFKTYNIISLNPSLKPSILKVLNKNLDSGVELGARWIGFSESGLGIHGTNIPEFIKILSTSKSIIMSNKDISELFNLVPVGTSVTII